MTIENIGKCESIEELMDAVNDIAQAQVMITNACMKRMDEILDQGINDVANEEYRELGDGSTIIQECFTSPEEQ